MKIFVFLADGFEEIEAIVPIDIFRRADIDVVTVSITEISEVTGAHGVTILADSIFSEECFTNCDLIFLPGGMPGTSNLAAHNGLHSLLSEKRRTHTKLAAICAAPIIFGRMGLLDNKEATCYPGYESQLKGAILSENDIAITDTIFTAKAAGKSIDFALEIVKILKGEKASKAIKAAIFYKA